MEENKVIVYTKINEHSCILDINSSVFLENTDGWIEIDSGIGDKYTHAQNCYFEKPVLNNNGISQYKLLDSKVVERTSDEIEADKPEPISPPPTTEQLTTEMTTIKEQINSIFNTLTTLTRNT